MSEEEYSVTIESPLGTFKGSSAMNGADRPCDETSDANNDFPRSDCGCLTYWVQGEEKEQPDPGGSSDHWWKWEARHEPNCGRIIVRRREAIEHSRSKL